MKKPVIGVTGLNAVDSPGPGVAVLRSLRESSLDPELIGLVYDVLEPGIFMDQLVKSSYVMPYPNSGPEALLERIRTINARKKIDIIIPTLDSELDNYIIVQNRLNEMGIHTFLPGKKQLHMRDKSILEETLSPERIPLPKTYSVNDSAAIPQICEKLEFPLFVKGNLYEAYLARNIQEATAWFHKLLSKWGIPIIFQQCIIGEECNVAALGRKGAAIGAVMMKKLFVTDKGKAWAGVTIDNPEVKKLSEKILDIIKWDGGCELEFIVENKTNKIFLLEINPRFPAWIYLATAAGQNMPEALAKICLGETVNPFSSYEVGKMFVRHSWDDIVPMKLIESLSTSGMLEKNN